MARSDYAIHSVELEIGGSENVPAIFQVPRALTPSPGVLLLHGFSSRKERMADSFGRALLAHGVASLAIDLPLHGARDGDFQSMSLRNPIAVAQTWRLAVREARAAAHYLLDQPSVDSRRIAIAGYSLGAYLAVTVAGDDPVVRAVALAAGGDLPSELPFASLVRAAVDPRRSVKALAGRPLYMINGKNDRTIRPDQARALFAAAGEPKEIHWYDGGHWPPQPAIANVATWLAAQLNA
jgi:uncharacterized protein